LGTIPTVIVFARPLAITGNLNIEIRRQAEEFTQPAIVTGTYPTVYEFVQGKLKDVINTSCNAGTTGSIDGNGCPKGPLA
jgi:hypothetical protein